MRTKLVMATAAGALAVGGLAFAVPAVADDDAPPAEAAASAEDRLRDALSGLVEDGSITQEQADEVATTLSGSGWHGGWGWGGSSVVTETLGLSEEELRTALEADGATLASVAEDQGVAVEDLVAALAEAVRERVATAVEEGRLTQEQADEWLADLETRITEAVQSTGPDGPDGWRGGWRGGWHGGGWFGGSDDGD